MAHTVGDTAPCWDHELPHANIGKGSLKLSSLKMNQLKLSSHFFLHLLLLVAGRLLLQCFCITHFHFVCSYCQQFNREKLRFCKKLCRSLLVSVLLSNLRSSSSSTFATRKKARKWGCSIQFSHIFIRCMWMRLQPTLQLVSYELQLFLIKQRF